MYCQETRNYILAYRLEDAQGISSDFYEGYEVIVPDGYFLGYINPCVYRDSEYRVAWFKSKIVEYLLFPSALTYESGAVLFTERDIISKSRLGI